MRPIPTLASNNLRKFLHFGREMKTDSRLLGTKPTRGFDFFREHHRQWIVQLSVLNIVGGGIMANEGHDSPGNSELY